MDKRANLNRLTALSTLILDQHLAQLQASAAARNASLQRLQDLVPIPSDDSDTVTSATTLMRYEHWADSKRREINLVLARQTAIWLEARKGAQVAFGRADVLRRIEEAQKKRCR